MLDPRRIPSDLAERLARITLSCLRREYPNQIAHAMQSDADAGTPLALHPAFFGCYDWHSAVHGHWSLVRLLRASDRTHPWMAEARRELACSLTAEKIACETAYVLAEGRVGFERPYGLAWVLRLDAELCEWPDAQASCWRASLEPLAEVCAERLLSWLEKLTHPVRTGVHSQSAFAISLALDRALAAGDEPRRRRLSRRATELYGADAGWSLAFEPSGEDFLSPSLGEADLMRRVLPADAFGAWLTRFLPELSSPDLADRLRPVRPLDPGDGRLAHLDGLSLSRAWMLRGVADALPTGDARTHALQASASEHLRAGLGSVWSDDYVRAHWLASFATYALTDPWSR